jgi:hypothetical protein
LRIEQSTLQIKIGHRDRAPPGMARIGLAGRPARPSTGNAFQRIAAHEAGLLKAGRPDRATRRSG